LKKRSSGGVEWRKKTTDTECDGFFVFFCAAAKTKSMIEKQKKTTPQGKYFVSNIDLLFDYTIYKRGYKKRYMTSPHAHLHVSVFVCVCVCVTI